jgi:hypothetical protein
MFRFTIRDVLWLMVVVAMGAGWYINVRAERAEKVEIVRKWATMSDEFREQVRAEIGLPPGPVPKSWPH